MKKEINEHFDNLEFRDARAAPKEELFQILREAHLATGHGKDLVMHKNVARNYVNISRVMCSLYCAECATCIKMRNNIKKGRTRHRPNIIVGFGSRGQVELVDMQSAEYEGMKWLLTYCDHGTKYAATSLVPNKQVIPMFCGASFSFIRC